MYSTMMKYVNKKFETIINNLNEVVDIFDIFDIEEITEVNNYAVIIDNDEKFETIWNNISLEQWNELFVYYKKMP